MRNRTDSDKRVYTWQRQDGVPPWTKYHLAKKIDTSHALSWCKITDFFMHYILYRGEFQTEQQFTWYFDFLYNNMREEQQTILAATNKIIITFFPLTRWLKPVLHNMTCLRSHMPAHCFTSPTLLTWQTQKCWLDKAVPAGYLLLFHFAVNSNHSVSQQNSEIIFLL